MRRSLIYNDESIPNGIPSGLTYYSSSIERQTSSGTYTIPTNVYKVDIFLVGGGGGGGAWTTWGYSYGLPGCGGGCSSSSTIYVRPGVSYIVTIGSGGSKATSRTGGELSASRGGSTTLKLYNTTYTATGGAPGINSKNGTYNDNWYTLMYDYGTYQTWGGVL
jgi:hypothetical protein